MTSFQCHSYSDGIPMPELTNYLLHAGAVFIKVKSVGITHG